ncbi:hypothetical protein A3G63_02820 [Candidatus Kaiserbacteria bacterium RIFCSPLOWO2_12_FULL_52_8]|uniref:Uncharacterized protein n=1 Tax=Candidatus Kaiserbacteria bacterium RIFCSPHIGHO2_01_FULL_53_31 TaxID=1798481 RepID=A0A1F6CHA6_9BACT|nr:MAG: hypothetical protein A2678_01990 [Candidatus Kaiserbacteria bacterium RIFCSPHIGHO2_01_FULL_53_31]OGG92855.1 MAG: hypothetical protein A3G63_02820 [Candidatus Kaiserbacteria bacterium RIFCSPLOWO2_12_FULL_52_8]
MKIDKSLRAAIREIGRKEFLRCIVEFVRDARFCLTATGLDEETMRAVIEAEALGAFDDIRIPQIVKRALQKHPNQPCLDECES